MTMPPWLVSDVVKTLVVSCQQAFNILEFLGPPANKTKRKMQILNTATASMITSSDKRSLLQGGHNPNYFGWQAYLIFGGLTTIYTPTVEIETILSCTGLFTMYLVLKANYNAANMQANMPTQLKFSFSFLVTLIIILNFIAVVGTLISASFSTNVIRHFANITAILFIVYITETSLFHLRRGIEALIPDEGGLPITAAATIREKLTTPSTGSQKTQLPNDNNKVIEDGKKSNSPQQPESFTRGRRRKQTKECEGLKKIRTKITAIILVMPPVATLAFVALVLVIIDQIEERRSYPAANADEANNYDPIVDAVQAVVLVLLAFFQWYAFTPLPKWLSRLFNF
eukprot:jgi/Bigna1/70038/fgenesh1_pg.10_\